MIRAIIFDFGNVIAFFDHHRATKRFEPKSRMSDDEMFHAIYDGPLEHDFESGKLSVDEFVPLVIERIGYRDTPGQFCHEFVDIFTPNPPVIGLIPRLKPTYKLVLGSNTNPLHAAHFEAEYADVLSHFDALGKSYEAGVRKPAAGFYHYCAGLAGVPPAECLFIDDIEKNVAGARATGMSTIVYSPEVRLAERLAEHGIVLA